MQGIIQLGDSVLDDVLSFRDGSLQQHKLLVHELLSQLLLLTRLHPQAYGSIHGYNVINELWSYISKTDFQCLGTLWFVALSSDRLLTLSFSLPCSSPSSLVFFSRSCWSDDCCTCAVCRSEDSSASFSLTDRIRRSFSACRATIELFACSDTWQTKADMCLTTLNTCCAEITINVERGLSSLTGSQLTFSLLCRFVLILVTSAIFSCNSLLSFSISNFCSSSYSNTEISP